MDSQGYVGSDPQDPNRPPEIPRRRKASQTNASQHQQSLQTQESTSKTQQENPYQQHLVNGNGHNPDSPEEEVDTADPYYNFPPEVAAQFSQADKSSQSPTSPAIDVKNKLTLLNIQRYRKTSIDQTAVCSPTESLLKSPLRKSSLPAIVPYAIIDKTPSPTKSSHCTLNAQRLSSPVIGSPEEQILRETGRIPSWYWGSISRSDAEEKLKDCPDGSYLVRNSTTPGTFTLTLRQDGKLRSLKIFCSEGKYGLKSQECIFSSLSALIEHYQQHTLAEFNKWLTTHLLHPVRKPHTKKINVYEALSNVAELGRKLKKEKEEYVDLLDKQDAATKTLILAQMEAQALDTAREMYETLINNPDQAADDRYEINTWDAEKKKVLKDNNTLAMKRHMMYREKAEAAAQIMKDKEDVQLRQVHDMNAHVPLLMDTEELCAQAKSLVLECGAKPELVECLLDDEEPEQVMNCTHWFVKCSREEAEGILAERAFGTFLIRPKEDHEMPYVLSIVCTDEDSNLVVKHCVIYHPVGRGYGFSRDGALFGSLNELVAKHACTSIKMYFSHMDTCLANPVFSTERSRTNSEQSS